MSAGSAREADRTEQLTVAAMLDTNDDILLRQVWSNLKRIVGQNSVEIKLYRCYSPDHCVESFDSGSVHLPCLRLLNLCASQIYVQHVCTRDLSERRFSRLQNHDVRGPFHKFVLFEQPVWAARHKSNAIFLTPNRTADFFRWQWRDFSFLDHHSHTGCDCSNVVHVQVPNGI